MKNAEYFRKLDQDSGAEMDRHAEAKEIIAKHRATVQASRIVPCPACDGGYRDDGNGHTVRCGQCYGRGRVATNGGEV